MYTQCKYIYNVLMCMYLAPESTPDVHIFDSTKCSQSSSRAPTNYRT